MTSTVTLRRRVALFACAALLPGALLVACDVDNGTNPIPAVPPFTPLEAGPDTGADGGGEGGPDGGSTATPSNDSGGSTTEGGEDAAPTPTDGSPD
jgi:hypothetical protein